MLPWIQRVLDHNWAYELITIIPQYEYTQLMSPAFTYEGMEYVVIVARHHSKHDYVCARVLRSSIDRDSFTWDAGNYRDSYDETVIRALELSRL
jgi:hypothetical protein